MKAEHRWIMERLVEARSEFFAHIEALEAQLGESIDERMLVGAIDSEFAGRRSVGEREARAILRKAKRAQRRSPASRAGSSKNRTKAQSPVSVTLISISQPTCEIFADPGQGADLREAIANAAAAAQSGGGGGGAQFVALLPGLQDLTEAAQTFQALARAAGHASDEGAIADTVH